MFRNLKCKNTILCELSFLVLPLLLVVAGFLGFTFISNEEIGAAVLVLSLVGSLILFVTNLKTIIHIDVTLSMLRSWQKDRLSFETDINGTNFSDVEKAISKRASKWGIVRESQNGAVFEFYKKTKTPYDMIKIVHQKLIIYSMPILTYEDYCAKLEEVKKSAYIMSEGKNDEVSTTAVIFLTDRADQTVLSSVRKDDAIDENENGIVIPVVYDALSRQYYFDAFYDYNLFVKATKNYLLDSVKKVVFGGKLPLENNDRFDYSNEISIWQDKTLGELLDDMKESEKREKQFVKDTAEQLMDGQMLYKDETLYIKHNGKLAAFMTFEEEDKPNDVFLFELDLWQYPHETEISKKDQNALRQLAIDYFSARGKMAVFDIEDE